MSRLFNRSVRVVAGTLEIVGLRTQFRIKKSLKKEPNEGEVSIYNLTEEHRRELSAKGLRVSVEAGYVGNTAQIFVGDVRYTDHAHERADWITRFQMGDGERAYSHARISESFKAGNTAGAVFRKIADALGLPAEKAQSVVDSLGKQFTQGAAIFGKASTELDKLLSGSGLDWSIQDGELQILAPVDTTSAPIVVLNASTGLIGSPVYGTAANSKPEEASQKPKILKIKCLLQPLIKPGGRVRLESETAQGDFKAQTVIHVGDTHGGDFFTEIEGTPIL